MNGNSVTRRAFMKLTGAATVALLEPALFRPASVLALGPFTRQDVGSLTATDPTLVSYKNAVQAMQALPDTNPLSWTYQAAIHGTTSSASHTAWNTCEHGTLYFLSWHRMYLWYFERIIRKMAADPGWALPYWNYEAPTQRKLPAPFRSPTSTSNPLYTSMRGMGWNAGTASLGATAVDTTLPFNDVPFSAFSGDLEDTPHGAVHIALGGLMGSTLTAAQDPIFWLHHANIDRLWDHWLTKGGGRTDPLNNTAWKNTQFTFFDEDGKEVKLTGCDILSAQSQLGYVYQNEPTPVQLSCTTLLVNIPRFVETSLIRIPPSPIVLPRSAEPVSVNVAIGQQRQQLLDVAASPATDLTLDLEQVEADVQPNVYYEVYLGLPNGAKRDAASPYYVGNVALFGGGVRQGHQHGEFRPARFSFKIDRAVSTALTNDRNAKQLTLLLVPRGADINGAPATPRPVATVRIGRAEISTRRLQQN
jgi:tyrosinase